MDKMSYKKIWTRAKLRGACMKIFGESEGLRKGQVDVYQEESRNKLILMLNQIYTHHLTMSNSVFLRKQIQHKYSIAFQLMKEALSILELLKYY